MRLTSARWAFQGSRDADDSPVWLQGHPEGIILEICYIWRHPYPTISLCRAGSTLHHIQGTVNTHFWSALDQQSYRTFFRLVDSMSEKQEGVLQARQAAQFTSCSRSKHILQTDRIRPEKQEGVLQARQAAQLTS